MRFPETLRRKWPALALLVGGTCLLLLARTQLAIEDLHLSSRGFNGTLRLLFGVIGFFVGLVLLLIGAKKAVSSQR